jgi:hypothetical protein
MAAFFIPPNLRPMLIQGIHSVVVRFSLEKMVRPHSSWSDNLW